MSRELEILSIIENLYPEAHCELNFSNVFELLCAVMLSAQTTDISVNKVTPSLFKKYPDPYSLSQANIDDVIICIKSIGLYHNKAANLINMAKSLCENFNGEVPDSRDELMSLAGVGRKTANVVLAVGFKKSAIAVDTHVERVAKRLGLAKQKDNVLEVEEKLMKAFPKEKWANAHHQLLFFGRYTCKSQRPLCDNCPLREYCLYL